MAASPGPSFRRYAIVGILFALPVGLLAAGIRFPAQPDDPWIPEHLPNDPDSAPSPESPSPPGTSSADRSPTSLERLAREQPCVIVVQGDHLPERAVLSRLRKAVDDLRAALPECRITWCGDAPSRTGILRRPRSVLPSDDAAPRHWDRALKQLQEHPLVVGHTLSEDGSTLLILLSDSLESTEQTARGILRQHLSDSPLQFWITGEMVLLREDERALMTWSHWILILSGVCVAVVGLFLLRDPRRSLAVAAGPFTALTLALGWDAFLGLPYNQMASANIPVFVLVLSFAESLHILLAVEEEYSHVQDERLAVQRAMARMLRPCFLTSLTTSLAFASLLLSDQPMVRGFGRNAAVAVAVAFFGIIASMPPAAAACVRRLRPERQHTGRRQDRWILGPILLSVRNPARITVMFTVLTGGMLVYSGRTLYPDDRVDLRVDTQTPAYQGLRQCDRHLDGFRQITVRISWPPDASDTDIWDVLTAVQQQVADSETFSRPLSILNALQLLPGRMEPRRLRYADRLARDRLSDFWNREQRFAMVEFRVPDRGEQYIADDLTALRRLLEQKTTRHRGFQAVLGGRCLEQSRLVRTTIREMLWSVLLAGVMILTVIWIAFGRLSYALYSILPNLFAVVFALTVRAGITPSLDIASACAASICLGIAVDDTIHFLEALRHSRGRPDSRVRIMRAGHLVGRPIAVTTITLFFGFITAFVAPLPTVRLFAAMVVAMLPAALLGDLMILPAVLSLFRSSGSDDIPDAADTVSNDSAAHPAADVSAPLPDRFS